MWLRSEPSIQRQTAADRRRDCGALGRDGFRDSSAGANMELTRFLDRQSSVSELQRSMKNRVFRIFAPGMILLISACSGASSSGTTLPFETAGNTISTSLPPRLSQFELQVLEAPKHRLCPVARPGHFECLAITSGVRVPLGSSSYCLHTPGCYGPSDLQAAYGIIAASASNGVGMTVALVDAYGYPGVAADLASYRSTFGLPACGVGCFAVVNQNGAAFPLPRANANWDGEQALDVDMVSAICPNCHIVLVEARNNSNANFVKAEKTAVRLANVVSNSWGGPEYATHGRTSITIPVSLSPQVLGTKAQEGDFTASRCRPSSPVPSAASFASVVRR